MKAYKCDNITNISEMTTNNLSTNACREIVLPEKRNKNNVKKGEIAVRTGTVVSLPNYEHDKGGYIFKILKNSSFGEAHYQEGASIHITNWRYATLEEEYCFNNNKITNISQITEEQKQKFKQINRTNYGDKNENLSTIEDARPNTVRPRAIGIRQPTKQIAMGIRFIGNPTKGKPIKKRITSIIFKTNFVKY